MGINLRTVDGFMAARAPAGPAAQKRAVILGPNVNLAADRLLLEMAAEAKRGVARDQQSGVHRTVRIVARGASFARRLVFKHERTKLRRVALGAGFILGHEFGAASHDHGTLVRIMAVAATYLAFDDGMMRRQVELGFFVQMTLETHFRRFARIDDRVGRAAGGNVQAARTVAGFAADVLGVVAGRLQMIMRRGIETPELLLMTLLARFRAGVSRPGNLRRRQLHPVDAGAGNHRPSGQHREQQEKGLIRGVFQPGNGPAPPRMEDRFHKD